MLLSMTKINDWDDDGDSGDDNCNDGDDFGEDGGNVCCESDDWDAHCDDWDDDGVFFCFTNRTKQCSSQPYRTTYALRNPAQKGPRKIVC